MPSSPYLRLLKNQIDITRVPFSDRGSRLVGFKKPEEDRLCETRTAVAPIEPWLDTSRFRPLYIQILRVIDSERMPLSYHLTTTLGVAR